MLIDIKCTSRIRWRKQIANLGCGPSGAGLQNSIIVYPVYRRAVRSNILHRRISNNSRKRKKSKQYDRDGCTSPVRVFSCSRILFIGRSAQTRCNTAVVPAVSVPWSCARIVFYISGFNIQNIKKILFKSNSKQYRRTVVCSKRLDSWFGHAQRYYILTRP